MRQIEADEGEATLGRQGTGSKGAERQQRGNSNRKAAAPEVPQRARPPACIPGRPPLRVLEDAVGAKLEHGQHLALGQALHLLQACAAQRPEGSGTLGWARLGHAMGGDGRGCYLCPKLNGRMH